MATNYRPARRVVTLSLDVEDMNTEHPLLTSCTLDITATDRFFNEREIRWTQRAYRSGLYARGSDITDVPNPNTPYVFETWEEAIQAFSQAAIRQEHSWALYDLLTSEEALVPEFSSAPTGWKSLAVTLPSGSTFPVMVWTGQSMWLCFFATGAMAAGTAGTTFGNAVFVRVVLPGLDAIGQEFARAAGPAARSFFRRVFRLSEEDDDQ
ncbi:hypothetical protein ACFCWG_33025 [Streptomyces sp. NPDC056390]|uniref:hypothetical protein n=1 Tax=Streptomyces sp. NPDC056390 TaxID=3345806 RepID=UPI0035DD5F42